MKIVVPADFSRLSEVAVRYACGVAKKLKAEIVLLHVVHFAGPPRAAVEFKIRALEGRMTEEARQDALDLIRRLKREFKGLKLSYEIISGHPVESVIEVYAKRNDADLIIMGTKGASGLQKVLIGSNAAAVISKSRLPVMAIPEHARFGKGVKTIVYASDLERVGVEMKYLIPLAHLFGASIHLLHVTSVKSKGNVSLDDITKKIRQSRGAAKVTVSILMSESVLEGIDQYVADVKADMLAMFTHNPSFIEKLFDWSVTRRAAFQTWIPLLTIKK
ncbi:MAG: universal stress protein [Cyclobacteriaceae bacterium]|nr:universal stress protein [Cyclobacteriaceae bacterium]